MVAAGVFIYLAGVFFVIIFQVFRMKGPIHLPMESLMAFAATALMEVKWQHLCLCACVCEVRLHTHLVCVYVFFFKRFMCIWVHISSLLLWTFFRRWCEQQWKLNREWMFTESEKGRSGSFRMVSQSGEWLFWCGAAGGEVGSSAVMAELWGGDWQPVRRRQTRSMTRQVRLEQSASAPCVDVVEIASSGNMLDEIVGSIENGVCQAAERLERQGSQVWAWMRIRECADQGSVTSVWWSNTIYVTSTTRGAEPVRLWGEGACQQ